LYLPGGAFVKDRFGETINRAGAERGDSFQRAIELQLARGCPPEETSQPIRRHLQACCKQYRRDRLASWIAIRN
jgi:hypothetical protein